MACKVGIISAKFCIIAANAIWDMGWIVFPSMPEAACSTAAAVVVFTGVS